MNFRIQVQIPVDDTNDFTQHDQTINKLNAYSTSRNWEDDYALIVALEIGEPSRNVVFLNLWLYISTEIVCF